MPASTAWRRPPATSSKAAAALLAAAACLVIGVAALGSGLGQLPLPDPLAALDRRLPFVFRAHMLLAGTGLALLPLAFLTRRWLMTAHRAVGRLTATLLALGALAAIPSALASVAVPAARAGFLAQGIVALFLLARAVRAIRRRDVLSHARAMRAMAAVMSGVVILRLGLWASAAAGWPFAISYPLLAWGSWLAPLLVIASTDRWRAVHQVAACGLARSGRIDAKAPSIGDAGARTG